MTIRTAFQPMKNQNIDSTPIRFEVSENLYQYTVPAGCKKLLVECVASRGVVAAGAAGKGGKVECILKVTPKQQLFLMVGKIGSSNTDPVYNASDLRINGTDLSSRIIVAGGGGSGGNGATSGRGGNGGDLIGENGSLIYNSNGGTGGTQIEGGKGGTSRGYFHGNGSDGTFGFGGKGGTSSALGGAGGAGWYGGGGGSGENYVQTNSAGGGGGSSYTHPELCSEVVHTQGFNDGNGYVILTPLKK